MSYSKNYHTAGGEAGRNTTKSVPGGGRYSSFSKAAIQASVQGKQQRLSTSSSRARQAQASVDPVDEEPLDSTSKELMKQLIMHSQPTESTPAHAPYQRSVQYLAQPRLPSHGQHHRASPDVHKNIPPLDIVMEEKKSTVRQRTSGNPTEDGGTVTIEAMRPTSKCPPTSPARPLGHSGAPAPSEAYDHMYQAYSHKDTSKHKSFLHQS